MLEVVVFELHPSGSEMVKPPCGKWRAVYFVESGMSPAGFAAARGTSGLTEVLPGGFALKAPADVTKTAGPTSMATPEITARTTLEFMN
jgi:hypothetical protein